MTRQISIDIFGSRDHRSNVTEVVTHYRVKIQVFSHILTLTYLGYFVSLKSWGGAMMAPPYDLGRGSRVRYENWHASHT